MRPGHLQLERYLYMVLGKACSLFFSKGIRQADSSARLFPCAMHTLNNATKAFLSVEGAALTELERLLRVYLTPKRSAALLEMPSSTGSEMPAPLRIRFKGRCVSKTCNALILSIPSMVLHSHLDI